MKPDLPTYECYGDYQGKNYGVHALRFFDAHGNCFWFSYTTLVAFCHNGKRVVLRNYWSTTTGKHLNCIDGGDKKSRVDQATFDRLYKQAFGQSLRVEP